MTDFVTVLTTVATEAVAKALARALVERKLAACVQRLQISSCYAWDGAIRDEPEILLLIKTRRALYPPLEAAIRELHAYTTPEIIALPVVAGSQPYLDWLAETTC